MPANLDESQQQIVLAVTTALTVFIVGTVVCVEYLWHVSNSKQQQQKKRQEANNGSSNHNKTHLNNNELATALPADDSKVVQGCIQTVFCMAVSTALFTWPITLLTNGNNNTNNTNNTNDALTSSINFCETDFQHSPYIAEPANVVSSVCSYIPLAVTGAMYTTMTTTSGRSRRFFLCYVTIFMIGVGSMLLHTFLTALTQGGDELPMLWYTAATGFCGFDVIVSSALNSSKKKNHKTTTTSTTTRVLATLVGLSAIASTCVYVSFRANFTYFYLMFSLYATILLLSVVYIALIMDWESKPNGAEFKRRVLLPLARGLGLFTILAVWSWALEMIGCAAAQQQQQQDDDDDNAARMRQFVWNRVLHPMWHYCSGIMAFLVVELFQAADGFSRGRGVPSIVWAGVPCVVFPDDVKSTKLA